MRCLGEVKSKKRSTFENFSLLQVHAGSLFHHRVFSRLTSLSNRLKKIAPDA
jgi:hypothetical protein